MRNAHLDFVNQVEASAAKQNLSLTEVARRAGLRDNTLYRLDSSEPKIGRVAAVCEALGLEFYIGPPRQDANAQLSLFPEQNEDTPGAVGLNEGVEKMAAQAEALRAEVASMTARLEAATSSGSGNTRRVREAELIIPTLMFLATRSDGMASTRDIIRYLEEWFQPSGKDAEILKGRKDSRFSQIVRNMISHRKDAGNFIHNGYAEYIKHMRGLRITEKGRVLLQELVSEGL